MDKTTKVQRWAEFLAVIRRFMAERGCLEVSTSAMVPAGAFEASIDVITASFQAGKMELHTSPEIEMKRLIAEIRTSIYQICKCYRDDPPTGIHLREFTMLEFYRMGFRYNDLIQDMKDLLEGVAGISLSFEECTVREAVLKATNIDIALAPDAAALRRAIEKNQAAVLSHDDTWDDMLFKLLIEKVEPSFNPKIPTVLKDYPLSMCALAKTDGERKVTERFEIYWHGMELCNGCTELDDFEEVQRRFGVESEHRRLKDKAPHPFPERLAEAFQIGFPPCAGVAVGLDRLFSCLATGDLEPGTADRKGL